MEVKVDYTVHHNYESQLDISIRSNLIVDDDFKKLIKYTTNAIKYTINATNYNDDNDDDIKVISINKHKKMNNLPSCQNNKEKPSYALFRIDVTTSNAMILSTWITSRCLEFLDAKDHLYKYIQLGNKTGQRCMPLTILLPFDTNDIDDICLPSTPCLLKASLGSGGFGIYFVQDKSDVVSIMKWHRSKAEQTPGFIDSLNADFGRVPLWSLQEYVKTTRVNNRRCQIRVYVVICEDHCYYYQTHEVRMPMWDCDLDDELSDSKTTTNDSSNDITELFLYDKECCSGTNARPYNKDRNKKETLRFITSEIDEISLSRTAVNDCITRAFNALKPFIQNQINEQNNNDNTNNNTTRNRIAISGVDLVISKKQDNDNEYEALIVELNNNPSCVDVKKKMSDSFNLHLKQLLSDIIILGLSSGKIQKNFCQIW